MIITTDAIVLHSRRYSDSSTIVTLYTRDYGKISVVAKGSRKPKSKFSTLHPLSIIRATYYYKPGRDLHTISNADRLVNLSVLTDSYEHLSTGLAIVETIHSTQVETVAHTELYDAIATHLQCLNNNIPSGAAADVTFPYFASLSMQTAAIMGFKINPESCPETDRTIDATQVGHFIFSFADGAPFDPVYAHNRAGYKISHVCVSALQTLAITPVETLHTLSFNCALRDELLLFFTYYFSFHLERKFIYKTKSMVFPEGH